MLAIGRGLMARPRWLLLDEPSLGLAPLIVTDLMERILRIRARRHDDPDWSSRTRTLRSRSRSAPTCWRPAGVALQGPARDLLANEEMQRAYLGSAVRVAAPA